MLIIINIIYIFVEIKQQNEIKKKYIVPET